mgnify:FL=1
MRNLTWKEQREFKEAQQAERYRQRFTYVIAAVFLLIALLAGGPDR